MSLLLQETSCTAWAIRDAGKAGGREKISVKPVRIIVEILLL